MTTNSSGGRGSGCLVQIALSVIIIGGLAAAWFWSQGADPRQAVQDGIVLGSKVTGSACVCALLAFLGFVGLAIVMAAEFEEQEAAGGPA